MTNAWSETSLPKILSRYKLKDIYNANEFSLFYQGLPKKTLHMKGEKHSGGKHSKDVKNVKSLPCCYKSQVKSWMNSFLFDECVKELDKKFEKENRKVILIVDNDPAHPIIGGLKAMELTFLPPNTTSKTQPMDQEVIRLKKYSKKIIQRLIRAVDMKKTFPNISILDAMQLLTSAWPEVSETTIKNCFRKVGISEKSAEEAINDHDDPFKDLAAEELEETINEFCERLPDEAPEQLNAAVLLDIDAKLY